MNFLLIRVNEAIEVFIVTNEGSKWSFYYYEWRKPTKSISTVTQMGDFDSIKTGLRSDWRSEVGWVRRNQTNKRRVSNRCDVRVEPLQLHTSGVPTAYTVETIFPFPFKLNGIWSWWQGKRNIVFSVYAAQTQRNLFHIPLNLKGKQSLRSYSFRFRFVNTMLTKGCNCRVIVASRALHIVKWDITLSIYRYVY